MKYKPTNREELKALCDDKNIYLGDIDTSLIADMSELFDSSYGSSRKDFSGVESWDVSNVEMMDGMFVSCPYSHSLESWGDKNPFKQDI